MTDQPDQAPAPEDKPAPAASPETVKGRFMARMATDDFPAYAILTNPAKALYDKHAHRLQVLQAEPASTEAK